MAVKMRYHWLLRDRMADHGIWKTTELVPLLAERGVHLSPSQVHRLATQTPERLSLGVLAALCDIFGCSPAELVTCYVAEPAAQRRVAGAEDLGDAVALRDLSRPRRALVDPERT
jgi:DNA-binding Xre family transcriptional regulator